MLTEQAQRQGVWALTSGPGRACAKRYPVVRAARSRSDGGNQTRKDERLRAALFISATMRSLELRQARARVALGSPELGREGEGATAKSMAAKRP
jgi:hypothetical protein